MFATRRSLWRFFGIIFLFLASVAGAHATHATHATDSTPSAIIFVCDGAGNFQACSQSFREAAESNAVPTCIETFEWSHGRYRMLADQLDYPYAQNAGACLARRIEQFHQQNPKCRIYLAGHSAGTSVVLSALEKIESGIVERAFLLAPSVSCRYELTPPLMNVKHAIHVYYSKHDWWYLGLATTVVGTQDRSWIAPAAGRVGFRYRPKNDNEEALACRLKQHPWKSADEHTGNVGGHFGVYQQDFLRRNVLPLTVSEASDHFLDAEDQEE